MTLEIKIALRHLLSKHNFAFISFSTFYSILGLFIGVSSLIIISCVSSGFNKTVNYKLSSIDGHLRINSSLNRPILENEIHYLDSIINNYNSVIHYPYIEKHAIIRNGGKAQGVIIYGVDEKALDQIFNLNSFSDSLLSFNSSNGIILGKKLFNLLEVKSQDEVIIINPKNNLSNNSLSAMKCKIEGTFSTQFSEYDKMLAFIPIERARSYFNLESNSSGIIASIDNPEDVEILESKLAIIFKDKSFYITTWKERHLSLINWLNVYDIPIKIIMAFIAIIGILNIAASLWMIIIEKKQEYAILLSLGLPSQQILKIILIQGSVIGLIGCGFSVLFTLIFLYLQLKLKFITLPEDIYFMSYLPVNISLFPYISYPLVAFCLTLICAYIPARYASRTNIAQVLNYE